jgi:hypothetical protein
MRRQKRRHSDAEVAEYWLTHDSADDIDWTKGAVRMKVLLAEKVAELRRQAG